MKNLKKADISASEIDYCLCEDGKVKNIITIGPDASKYRTDDDSISNNDSIPFYIIFGETLKIKGEKYFTRVRDVSCYVCSDDLDKLILDEYLIDKGKLCIDLKDDSIVSSDYQLIPEEEFKELKQNRVDEYFES